MDSINIKLQHIGRNRVKQNLINDMEFKVQQPTIKKELILREQLAIQRTILANQTTFLAFLRSAMYFLVAGLSINELIGGRQTLVVTYILFSIAIILLIGGIVNFFINRDKIKQCEIHVGDYKLNYERAN